MESCKNCKYWEDHGDEEDAKPREGNCRRYPPQHNGINNINDPDSIFPMHASWDFPVTGGHWWCGEYKKDDINTSA